MLRTDDRDNQSAVECVTELKVVVIGDSQVGQSFLTTFASESTYAGCYRFIPKHSITIMIAGRGRV